MTNKSSSKGLLTVFKITRIHFFQDYDKQVQRSYFNQIGADPYHKVAKTLNPMGFP